MEAMNSWDVINVNIIFLSISVYQLDRLGTSSNLPEQEKIKEF